MLLAGLVLALAPSLQQGEPAGEDLPALPAVVSEAPRASGALPDEDEGRLELFGRFHPLTVHFPIALILAAGLAEVLLALHVGGDGLRASARYCLALGALSAVVSAMLGWAAHTTAPVAPMLEDTLDRHQWLGFATAVTSVAAVACGEAARRSGARRWRRLYVVGLAAACALVGVTGHFGGTLVFGPDHFGS